MNRYRSIHFLVFLLILSRSTAVAETSGAQASRQGIGPASKASVQPVERLMEAASRRYLELRPRFGECLHDERLDGPRLQVLNRLDRLISSAPSHPTDRNLAIEILDLLAGSERSRIEVCMPKLRTADRGLVTGVSGSVTVAGTGFPLSNVYGVELYDFGGTLTNVDSVDEAGTFQFFGLSAGTYYARTRLADYIDELWDDIPCPSNCDVTKGSGIVVFDGVEDYGNRFCGRFWWIPERKRDRAGNWQSDREPARHEALRRRRQPRRYRMDDRFRRFFFRWS